MCFYVDDFSFIALNLFYKNEIVWKFIRKSMSKKGYTLEKLCLFRIGKITLKYYNLKQFETGKI